MGDWKRRRCSVDMMRLNLKRGFNRLFLVFAVGWYLAAIVLLCDEWRAYQTQRHEYISLSQAFGRPAPGAEGYFFDENGNRLRIRRKPIAPDGPISTTALALVVPAAIYLSGLTVVWIGKGFGHNRSGTQD